MILLTLYQPENIPRDSLPQIDLFNAIQSILDDCVAKGEYGDLGGIGIGECHPANRSRLSMDLAPESADQKTSQAGTEVLASVWASTKWISATSNALMPQEEHPRNKVVSTL